LLPMPFTDLRSRKVWPAVVMHPSSHPRDLLPVPISLILENVDFRVHNWRAAELNVPCGVKSRISSIEDLLIVRSVGLLSSIESVTSESVYGLGSGFGTMGLSKVTTQLTSLVDPKKPFSVAKGRMVRARVAVLEMILGVRRNTGLPAGWA
jgi:hypothetical protein